MKLLKYLLLALTAVGSIQAIEIIDGKGTKYSPDPIVLEHSTTLNEGY